MMPSSSPRGDRVLILGGVRSGKSATAERLATTAAGDAAAAGDAGNVGDAAAAGDAGNVGDAGDVHYLATAQHIAGDVQWARRITDHQQRRPAHWRTIETGDVAAHLTVPGPVLLVESITTWLARIMENAGCFTEPDISVAHDVDALITAWETTTRPVIAVSDEVGLGGIGGDPLTRRFADELGLINQRLAASADQVLLVVAGHVIALKGGEE